MENTPLTDKEKRINKEYKRLYGIFETMDANQLLTITALIQNCAFMRVTLEDLQKDINEKGFTECYQHGENQNGLKPTTAISQYNAMIRNYTSVIKELVKIAPKENKPDKLAEFMASFG